MLLGLLEVQHFASSDPSWMARSRGCILGKLSQHLWILPMVSLRGHLSPQCHSKSTWGCWERSSRVLVGVSSMLMTCSSVFHWSSSVSGSLSAAWLWFWSGQRPRGSILVALHFRDHLCNLGGILNLALSMEYHWLQLGLSFVSSGRLCSCTYSWTGGL